MAAAGRPTPVWMGSCLARIDKERRAETQTKRWPAIGRSRVRFRETGKQVAGRRGGPPGGAARRLWRWRWWDVTGHRGRRWWWNSFADTTVCRDVIYKSAWPGGMKHAATPRGPGTGTRADSASVSLFSRTSTLGRWRRRDATSPYRRTGRCSFATVSLHTGGRRCGPGRRGRRRVPGGKNGAVKIMKPGFYSGRARAGAGACP